LGAFGEKLRKQREQRGLALDAISNITKISPRMLRALEEEHFDQLPGGVFNKGFVRAYARQVGLNEEEAITDYLAALRESQMQSQQILPDFRNPAGKARPVPAPDSRRNILSSSDHTEGNHSSVVEGKVSTAERRRSEGRRNQDRREHRDNEHRNDEHHSEAPSPDATSMPGFITLGAAAEEAAESADRGFPRVSLTAKWCAALLLMIVGLSAWLYYRHQQSASSTAVGSNPSPSVPALSAPAPSVPALQSPVPAVTRASAPKVAAGSSELNPSVRKSSAPPPSQPTRSSPTVAPKPAASPSDVEMLVASSTTTTPTKPPATFRLTIRADQTTWISITADGKAIAHETLIAPAHTSVQATREISVRVGNAAGVSFLLNGREFPAEGNSGEAKTYIFDAAGLKPAQAPSAATTSR
jgi:cytoskeletal protein RodZ